jgi:hypothetical protein
MIYPVKVLDKNGKVKKVISTSALQDDHWKRFYEDENNIGLMNGPRNANVPSHVRKRMAVDFAGLYDMSFSFIN